MASVRWRGRRVEVMHSVHASRALVMRHASATAAARAFLPSFSCTFDHLYCEIYKVSHRKFDRILV